MHHENVLNREPFGFISRIIRFIQPAWYASVVNKTYEISKQNKHMFILDAKIFIAMSESKYNYTRPDYRCEF